MNNEIRLSLSAAREDDGQPLHIATEGSLNQLPMKHRKGWTPAPTKPAYSQTNVSLAHKGRDYDAILRAAKRKPVGYWEDAPTGIKFGGGGNTEKASGLTKAKTPDTTQNATAPTTPPQSGDGVWPKCLLSNCGNGVIVYADDGDGGTFCGTHGERWKFSKRYTAALTEIPPPMLKKREPLLIADAIRRLEQNGHKDAAAQLRGKAADDGLYEPVGTMPVAGDVVRWGEDLIKITRIDSALQFSVRFNRAGGQEDGLFMSYFSDRRHAPLRILKRKPTVQREPLHA